MAEIKKKIIRKTYRVVTFVFVILLCLIFSKQVSASDLILSPSSTSISSTTPSENPLAPLPPKIFSSTHPDPNKWYKNNHPIFSWDLPLDVTGVRLFYNNNPSTAPTKKYEPAVLTKDIGIVKDGVYYFHIQYKNSHGWGGITHFRFKIDTVAPVPFTITFPQGVQGDNPQPEILFNTNDALSGINHYEIKIGEGNLISLAPAAISNPYVIPNQQPGKRSVIVRAVDEAGNSTLQSAEFIITSIEVPKIILYPEEMKSGDILKVRGTTYPDAVVTLFLKDAKGKIKDDSTQSNTSGDFSIVWTRQLTPGVYEMTLQVTDKRGAKSLPTQVYKIVVKDNSIFYFGSYAVNYFILLLITLAFITPLIYFFVTLKKLTKKFNEKFEEKKIFHEELDHFKNDLKEELAQLNKRIENNEKELHRYEDASK